MTTPSVELRSAFGEIDIYLFDQLARGHFDRRRRVLDAGCGDGRNLVFFLKNGFTCFGIDRDQSAIAQVRALATRLAPAIPPAHFVTGELDELPWPDGSMDAVIASAVLHFVRDEPAFRAHRPGALASPGPRWAAIRSAGLDDRAGGCSGPCRRYSRAPSRRLGSICRRFGDASGLDGTARWSPDRPDQDHQRARATMHDDLVYREASLTGTRTKIVSGFSRTC